MKGFKKTRRLDETLAERLLRESPELGPDLVQHLQKALPAIAMDGHPALTTAYANDCAPLMCFAQQVNGYGRAGDVLLVISTSAAQSRMDSTQATKAPLREARHLRTSSQSSTRSAVMITR